MKGLKTFRKMSFENILSHNVFYPSQNKVQFMSHSLLSANAFNFNKPKILQFGEESTLSHTTHFGLAKLEDFVDDNFKFDENCRKFSELVENTVGEKEKMIVTSNFAFPHSVFKRL